MTSPSKISVSRNTDDDNRVTFNPQSLSYPTGAPLLFQGQCGARNPIHYKYNSIEQDNLHEPSVKCGKNSFLTGCRICSVGSAFMI